MSQNKGRFTSERLKGNQFAKGNQPNKTSFQKGSNHTGERHPSWKGGVQTVKNDCTYLNVGTNKRVRRPRAIWESANGKMPAGYVIYHIDGDKNNDDLNNLMAITRSELLKLNREKHVLD